MELFACRNVRFLEAAVTLLAASAVWACRCGATMVGVVVARGSETVVERDCGGAFRVEGFVRVDVGDRVLTGREGAQVLLFDNDRAQLMPEGTYRVGKTGVYKRQGQGFVLAHGFRRPFLPGVQAPAPGPRARVGLARLGTGALVVRPGPARQAVSGTIEVRANDAVQVPAEGAVRLDMEGGSVVHIAGPALVYAHDGSVEVELGRVLIVGTAAKRPLSVGLALAELVAVRSTVAVSADADGIRVTSLGGRVTLRGRLGLRERSLGLRGMHEVVLDGGGRVQGNATLAEGAAATALAERVRGVLAAAEGAEYGARLAETLAAVEQAARQARGARQAPVEVTEPEPAAEAGEGSAAESEAWKNEVEQSFQTSPGAAWPAAGDVSPASNADAATPDAMPDATSEATPDAGTRSKARRTETTAGAGSRARARALPVAKVGRLD